MSAHAVHVRMHSCAHAAHVAEEIAGAGHRACARAAAASGSASPTPDCTIIRRGSA